MAIRLLALDLDGTLLNSRGEITQHNQDAIQAARKQGVRVAIVTGRRFRDARPLALKLGLDVPVISHNGALTKHARTLETVAARLLPLAEAHKVLHIGRTHGADPMVSDDPVGTGLLVYDYISEDNHALAKYIQWSRRVVGSEAEEAVRRVPSLEEYLDHAPVHIAFSGTCASIQRLGESLERTLASKVKVLSTIYPKQDFALLDVLHPEASKGAGLAAVAIEYNLAREEVMAVGDNFNDLEMLHYAGTGVVMGNAAPPLRDIQSFHLTASNDEDGVAEAIERFILRAER
ncbi:MAG: HAD family phosphatase [Pyrinomonadaceae bacterium]|nr:HAD family phosphatase [Pyrinomonadaceae bacterium]